MRRIAVVLLLTLVGTFESQAQTSGRTPGRLTLEDGTVVPFVDFNGVAACGGEPQKSLPVRYQGSRRDVPIATIRQLRVVEFQVNMVVGGSACQGWHIQDVQVELVTTTGTFTVPVDFDLHEAHVLLRDDLTGEIHDQMYHFATDTRRLNIRQIEFDHPAQSGQSRHEGQEVGPTTRPRPRPRM